jgi:hypothetical protein
MMTTWIKVLLIGSMMTTWIKVLLIVIIGSTTMGILIFTDDELMSVFMAPSVILLALFICFKVAWHNYPKKPETGFDNPNKSTANKAVDER